MPEGLSDGGFAEVMRSDHPLPTDRSVVAGESVLRFVREVRERARGEGTRLVVCMSGGASALVCLEPMAVDARGRTRLTVRELAEVASELMRRGAAIDELNCVRKHTEAFKGGGLARELGGAVDVDVLVLSDVLGDDVSTIGSGAFARDATSAADALRVLEKFGLMERCPKIVEALRWQADMPRQAEATDLFDRVRHHVVANNASAVDAAAEYLRGAGCEVRTRLGVTGEAAERGREFARELCGLEAPANGRAMALVWGGETTVRVRGRGHGGRNQEAALAAAGVLARRGNVCAAMVASDGVDGVFPAGARAHAGAIVDSSTVERSASMGVDLDEARAESDSYRACRGLGIGVETGATGTNVNDVWVGVRMGGIV